MVRLSDLRTREVINIIDGKKLGNIIDIELDIEYGRVLAIMLPGQSKGWSVFARKEEIVVPWEKIVRIGRDVILVEAHALCENDHPRKGYRRHDDDEDKY